MRRIVVAVMVSCALVMAASAVQLVPPSQDKPAQQVEVINLPLDGNGNLRVASGGPAAARLHVVGITAATLPFEGNAIAPGPLVLNRACEAEFPASRACGLGEAIQSIPPPPAWQGMVAVFEKEQTLNDSYPLCISSDGYRGNCSNDDGSRRQVPVMCCGD